jgi:hypothetical protein
MRTHLSVCLLAIVLVGCAADEPPAPISIPQFGEGEPGATAGVALTEVAGFLDGLKDPRDLAFNPLRPDELWIVNATDDSVVIVTGATGAAPSHEKRIDGYAMHFMDAVTAIAFGGEETTFGVPGTFGTCQESRNTYNGQAAPNDFMGPTLWSSDLDIFAMMNPNGLGSHLDMLHNTPLCMGITHEAANRYWVVGGMTGAIDRYDFAVDDGIGNDEHGDGLTWRYAPGTIGYVEKVPSHLVLDPDSGMLYVADPGNARIVRLDTATGTAGASSMGLETAVTKMEGAVVEDFVPASAGLLGRPSGVELHDGVLFVSDNLAGRLFAFDAEGELLSYLETGLPGGALAGIAIGPDDKLYLVDGSEDRVLRVDPL